MGPPAKRLSGLYRTAGSNPVLPAENRSSIWAGFCFLLPRAPSSRLAFDHQTGIFRLPRVKYSNLMLFAPGILNLRVEYLNELSECRKRTIIKKM